MAEDLGEEAPAAATALLMKFAAAAAETEAELSPGEGANGGGEAGELGPPLEHPGGLIRFSFWRLERDQA